MALWRRRGISWDCDLARARRPVCEIPPKDVGCIHAMTGNREPKTLQSCLRGLAVGLTWGKCRGAGHSQWERVDEELRR